MNDQSRTDAWSHYWSLGHTTSLPDLFPANYSGGISAFWNDAFASLKDDSRVLDICTGNGAIALLAWDFAQSKGIRCDIHAIDAARITPSISERSNTAPAPVIFHSRVPVEGTPFSNRSFDLIVGQFALEYCNAVESIRELARIIKPDGALVLMLHHSDSPTVRSTHEFITIGDTLFDKLNIPFRLRRYAQRYSRHKRKTSRNIAHKQQQLESSINKARDLLKQFPDNRLLQSIIQNIENTVARIHNERIDHTATIREFEKKLRFHLMRSKDLRDAALDGLEMYELQGLLLRNGFPRILCQPFHLDGTVFSWTLKAWPARIDEAPPSPSPPSTSMSGRNCS